MAYGFSGPAQVVTDPSKTYGYGTGEWYGGYRVGPGNMPPDATSTGGTDPWGEANGWGDPSGRMSGIIGDSTGEGGFPGAIPNGDASGNPLPLSQAQIDYLNDPNNRAGGPTSEADLNRLYNGAMGVGTLSALNDSLNNGQQWQTAPGEEPMLDSSGNLMPYGGGSGSSYGGGSQGWQTAPGEEPMLDSSGNLMPYGQSQNGGYGYATTDYYGGYPVGGDATINGAPNPEYGMGSQLPGGYNGQPGGLGSAGTTDAATINGYPNPEYGMGSQLPGGYNGQPGGLGSGGTNDVATINGYPNPEYGMGDRLPGGPNGQPGGLGSGSYYGDTGGGVITNADLPSGGGLNGQPGGQQYGTGQTGTTGSTSTPNTNTGTQTQQPQQQETGQAKTGTSTSAPPRELPTPFGSKNFQTNPLPGDEGQPATGSKDTVALMQQLRDLVANPGQTASNPGYQFLMDQGMNALNRTAAAKRQRFSGNAALEAANYGQGLASTQYQTLANVLQNSLGKATSQYGQDVGRYLGEQGIIQGYGADSYNAWLNRQRDAGASQSANLLSQLAQSLNLA